MKKSAILVLFGLLALGCDSGPKPSATPKLDPNKAMEMHMKTGGMAPGAGANNPEDKKDDKKEDAKTEEEKKPEAPADGKKEGEKAEEPK